MAAIFVGDVDPSSTIKNIYEIINNAGINEDTCDVFETNIRANSRKAFKVMVPEDHQDMALASLSNIENLRVEKWGPRQKRSASHGGGTNGNKTFRGPHPHRRGPQPHHPGRWNPGMPPFWGPPPPPHMWNNHPFNYNY